MFWGWPWGIASEARPSLSLCGSALSPLVTISVMLTTYAAGNVIKVIKMQVPACSSGPGSVAVPFLSMFRYVSGLARGLVSVS